MTSRWPPAVQITLEAAAITLCFLGIVAAVYAASVWLPSLW